MEAPMKALLTETAVQLDVQLSPAISRWLYSLAPIQPVTVFVAANADWHEIQGKLATMQPSMEEGGMTMLATDAFLMAVMSLLESLMSNVTSIPGTIDSVVKQCAQALAYRDLEHQRFTKFAPAYTYRLREIQRRFDLHAVNA